MHQLGRMTKIKPSRPWLFQPVSYTHLDVYKRQAFNWSTAAHQDQIDSILSEAWRVLTQQAKLLISSGDGYQLDLKDLSFRLPETVYQCPVSRRFIDTPFEQLSPYTPRTDREMVVKVTPYTRCV